MADSTLSALPAASALGGTEIVYGVQSSADVKITATQIKTFATAAPMTLASGTLTDPSTALTISATYNDGADTFKSLVLDITNTASASASRPFQINVGGSSRLAVDVNGYLRGAFQSIMFGSDTVCVAGNDAFLTGTIFGVGSVGNYVNFVVETAVGNKVVMNSGMLLGFSSSAVSTVAADTLRDNMDVCLGRAAAGVISVRGTSTSVGGALNFLEQTAPSAPSANQVVVYAEDNGSGKTRLMARFNTGAAQVLATEP